MRLPVVKSCCGCASLVTGSYILGGMAICGALLCIAMAAWPLPHHRSRAPEDNLIGMMTIMNASLSVIFNGVLILGVRKKRPGCVQTSMLFNGLLVLFGCLLVLAKCLFSPEYQHACFSLAHALLGALFTTAAVVFVINYFITINSVHLRLKQSSLVPTPVPV